MKKHSCFSITYKKFKNLCVCICALFAGLYEMHISYNCLFQNYWMLGTCILRYVIQGGGDRTVDL